MNQPFHMFRFLAAMIIALFFLPTLDCLWAQEEALADKGQDSGPNQIFLVSVPVPNLNGFEDEVAQQLAETRKTLDALDAKSDIGVEDLASAYGDQGHLYVTYGLREAAEACYRNACMLNPKSFIWNYCLGYVLKQNDQFAQALQSFQLAKSTGQYPDLVYLVEIRKGECLMGMGQTDQARRVFESARELKPDDAAAIARLGLLELGDGKFDAAIELLSAALKIVPESEPLRQLHLKAAIGREGAKVSIAPYSRPENLEIEPEDPLHHKMQTLLRGSRAHLAAGRNAVAAGRWADACTEFEAAIAADGKLTVARVELARCLMQLNQLQSAVKELKSALKVEPQLFDAHYFLGVCYWLLGDYAPAIEHLNQALDREPRHALARFYLAQCLLKKENFDSAFDQLKAAVQLQPDLARAWVLLSQILMTSGQYDEALQILETAHEQLPKNIPITLGLARLLASSPILADRDGKRALGLALEAFETNIDFESARSVAMAYAEMDQCDKAQSWMERSLDMASRIALDKETMEMLQRNLEHFKQKRPCRIPPEPK